MHIFACKRISKPRSKLKVDVFNITQHNKCDDK